MGRTLLIFGCGYTCKILGQQLVADGWTVHGTVRSKSAERELCDLGIIPLFWDDESSIKAIISKGCYVLDSIPPSNSGSMVVENYYSFMIANKEKINWVGLLSSTGVYGNTFGDWVTEESVTNTKTKTGKLRIQAEKTWQKFFEHSRVPLFIFRLSGIYGKSRSIFERIQAGTANKIYKEGQYFNRIHVDDIVGTIKLALDKPSLYGIYNISDDLPTGGGEVIDEATNLLKHPSLEEIHFRDAKLSEKAKEFYSESKRVSNKKLKETLGYCLKHPTYKSGLTSILDRMEIK